MSRTLVEVERHRMPVAKLPVEVVERKGMGHPDSLCDAAAEEVSQALCGAYHEQCGRVLHFNADKSLLVAGQTEPRLGGGKVTEPMRLIVGDRATRRWRDRELDIGSIVEQAVRRRLRRSLRYADLDSQLVVQCEMKEGSSELAGIFASDCPTANDTSAAVGYAPLTETEQIVLAAERWLTSPDFQLQFPEAGEDVKVMGVRRHRQLGLTCAIAMVDHQIPDPQHYFDRKEAMRCALVQYLQTRLRTLDHVQVEMNRLDDPSRGSAGMYLTVTGTSAEAGDCGQVGRGNRVNGLIPLNRPVGNEAAAGKNPISHVGKIYSLLAHHTAQQVAEQVAGVAEVYVWYCSQIGRPIHAPLLSAAHLVLNEDACGGDVARAVRDIIDARVAEVYQFRERIVRGEFPVW
jgi:S-adenosylmethionine synthetase